MLQRALLSALLSVATLANAQPGTPPPAQRAFPIQAELVASLSANKLKPGDRILVKLKREWTYNSCTLARGSAIVGHVTALNPWSQSSKVTTVSMLFDAPCGDAAPVPLTWIALLAPDDSDLAGLHSGNPVAVQALRSNSFGEDNGLRQSTNTRANYTDLSGRQNPNLPTFLGPAPDRSKPRPTAVTTGQVWNIPDLKLAVGAGPLGSSTLSSKKKELHLLVGSVLVLSPEAVETASAAAPISQPPVISAPVDPALAFKDQCLPPSCAIVARLGALLATNPPVAQTLPLGSLGYHRLNSAEMLDFEYGAALAYLGPDHLLFTFNPHTLVPRLATADPADHPHMVRAVLFNLRTSSTVATQDWCVGDNRQYLWQLADGRVLVHAGDRLRLLGLAPVQPTSPDSGLPAPAFSLQEFASVPLSSRLAFVRNAPDRKHLAVGVVRELHTADIHAKLAEANSNGAEEEVSILLFDRDLKPIESSRQSSFAMPPILSDHGRVTLLHAGGERWRYAETSWTGQSRTFARLSSSCIPEMSTLSSSLFFVTGCDPKKADRWYRVLRSDGSTVLKGGLLSMDLDPLPIADTSGETVALALPSVHAGYLAHSPFHGADLSSEVIRVFRSSDGRSVFTANLHAPTPTKQPLAFAPGGTSLAVLDGEQIVIYLLHPSPDSTSQPILAATGAPTTLP